MNKICRPSVAEITSSTRKSEKRVDAPVLLSNADCLAINLNDTGINKLMEPIDLSACDLSSVSLSQTKHFWLSHRNKGAAVGRCSAAAGCF